MKSTSGIGVIVFLKIYSALYFVIVNLTPIYCEPYPHPYSTSDIASKYD